MSSIDAASGTYLYFGFGSNLNTVRLRINSPSAKKVGVGRLKDYKLIFGHPAEFYWPNGVASVQKSPGDEVIGVVYRIQLKTLPALDRQEGVKERCYHPFDVFIYPLEGGNPLICRTYQIVNPVQSLPTELYKEVILSGAKEHSLPEEYVLKLQAVKTNKNVCGSVESSSYKIALKASESTVTEDEGDSGVDLKFESPMHMTEGYFFYFSYGESVNSNYFKSFFPRAEKIDVAQLKGYKLIPCGASKSQNYTEVTILPSSSQDGVYGVLWKVHIKDFAALEQMKCVHIPLLHPFDVKVTTLGGKQYLSRVYKAIGDVQPGAVSSSCKETMLEGAKECSFPEDYINMIKNFKITEVNTPRERVEFTLCPSAINVEEGYVMYFGFASNLKTDLLHSHISSAEKVSVAQLLDYELCFCKSQFFNPWPREEDYDIWDFEEGGRATLRKVPGSAVWGVVWRIRLEDLPVLDWQERLHLQGYFAFDVSVIPVNSTEPILCRTFSAVCPEKTQPPGLCYISTIISGAKEHNLPADYINGLTSIQYNDDITS